MPPVVAGSVPRGEEERSDGTIPEWAKSAGVESLENDEHGNLW
jgi:hypothetical protein